MGDTDKIPIELSREQWRKVQVNLMQAETDIPDANETEFQEIVEEIDEQIPQ